jgi:isoquinoline 1-oxidoreductase beta subunit
MSRIGKIARRSFLVGSAAIVGGVAFGVYKVRQPAPAPTPPASDMTMLTPFIFIDANGVTLIAPRAEMGQGVQTSWAALIAEELDVELDQVTVVHGPAAKAYYNSAMMAEALPGRGYDASDWYHSLGETIGHAAKLLNLQVTGGSSSMKDGFTRMRIAGASARETLKQAAANRLNVDRATLKTRNGSVIAADGTRISYGELADEAGKIDTIETTALRPAAQWRLIGKSQRRIDMLAKSTGTAEFGVDVRLPGMVFASLRQSPRFGAAMVSFDPSTALSMAGVLGVHDLGDAIAVTATNTWLAIQAVNAVQIEWAAAPYPETTDAIFDVIAASFDGDANSIMRDDGDVDVLPDGAQIIEAEYRVPYLAHATMEPMNATALFSDGKLSLWAPNQGPTIMQRACANALDIDPTNIDVHTTYLGGGFGRRIETDYCVRAAQLAEKLPGTPVQLTWSREEDMTHDAFRPGAIARYRGAVKDGKAIMVDGKIAAQSASAEGAARMLGLPMSGPDKGHVDGAFNQPYSLPNFRVQGFIAPPMVPVGFWRSVGASFNGFFSDTIIDEMAHAAERDPLEFRIELARPEHMPSAQVLEKLAEMSNWGGPKPPNTGRGVGFAYSFGTPVAAAIEVEDRNGDIRINKCWMAADLGTVIDPSIVEAQLISAAIYGLSAAAHGEITFIDGAVEQQNFPDYDALRMYSAPTFDIALLENNHHMGGAGEPGTPPIMPALGNALFDLTGTRARSLPLNKHFNLLV